MTNIDDDLLGLEDDGRPHNQRSKKARKSLGPLHDLLTEKFPHLVDQQSGVCNLHRIARLRDMTFQGVYKWFRRRDQNRLPYAQAIWFVELSKKFAASKDAPRNYKPMTLDDIGPFISKT